MALEILTRARRALRQRIERIPSGMAIGLGLVETDPEYAGRIRAAQIAGVVRLTPLAMIASSLNAVILLVTLGHVGALHASLWVWAVLVFALALYYARGWMKRGERDPGRPASRRAMRRAVLHAAAWGALWGVVPVMTYPGAPLSVQLLIGCLSAGMMCAGGFVMATVPLAGWSYVGMIAAGSYYALLREGTPIDIGLTALLVVYTAVVITNLTWNAHLFVDHFLAEARLQQEVTARERAQAQVAHSQRMTALGELAGGIAHDFNNILQAVAGNASLIEHRAADAPQVRQLSGMIQEAAERGGAISRRLLAFARQDLLSAEPVDAGELLDGARELAEHAFGPAIVFRVEVAPGLPRLLADKAQLETVLVNLATNARDAMPRGGTLTLSATAETVARDRDDPPLAAGRYIRISVADSGVGMDAATLARATEPFFTTKPKGKGTGLGLPMAKGFAEQSGGAFALSSEPGHGTIVAIWLPQTDAPARPARIRQPAASPGLGERHVHSAEPHVLLVDDDDLVRETLLLALEDTGFAIAGAGGGGEALERIDRGEAVDALVTDFAMPGMNGIELIRAVQARRPGLPAILLTGHVGDVASLGADSTEGARFTLLQKPIRPDQLAERLEMLLAAEAA